jgi:diaminopimelate epimerase
MRFAKYHALGNDYLVLEQSESPTLTPALARRICDRHLGLGADGILLRVSVGERDCPRLRIFNPDGSEAEKSGNGLRIFARYLWDRALVGNEPFAVATLGGEVSCTVVDDGRSVTVDMGRVSFDSAAIPVAGPRREVLNETLVAGGQALEFSAATIGNPHCVIRRERVSADEARALGALVESDARFPNRTNVQFLQVLDRRNLRIEIWERGAGYTLASGSSSCAAAAVARRLGLCDPVVTVHMPGGTLAIEIDASFAVRMSGPVVRIGEGELSPECLEGA